MIPSITKDRFINYAVVEEVIYTDNTTQNAALDTLTPVTFNSSTGDTPLISKTNGTISFLKAGPYVLKARGRLARLSSSGGSAKLIFVFQASADNGLTWNIVGAPVAVRLLDLDQEAVLFDTSFIKVEANTQFRIAFARSSEGFDDGFLAPSITPAALVAEGVPNIPSAQLTIYKFEGFKY